MGGAYNALRFVKVDTVRRQISDDETAALAST